MFTSVFTNKYSDTSFSIVKTLDYMHYEICKSVYAAHPAMTNMVFSLQLKFRHEQVSLTKAKQAAKVS